MEFSTKIVWIFCPFLIALITQEAYGLDVCYGTGTKGSTKDGFECGAPDMASPTLKPDTGMDMQKEEQDEQFTGSDLISHIGGLTTELYRSQYEAAKFFEIAYYSVSNFPDVAIHVRLSAHLARTSHELSVSLMKKFGVTGDQIVVSVIPHIIQAVDLGNVKVVKSYFNMIIKWSNDMQNEAEDTRSRYLELQGKLQTDIELIREKKKNVTTEKEEISLKMKQQRDLAAEAEKAKKELEAEKVMNENELARLKKLQHKTSENVKEGMKSKSNFWLQLLPVFGPILAMQNDRQQGKNLEGLMKTLITTQESIDKTHDRHLKIVLESQRHNKEAIERMHTMKKLQLRDELLGDESSLLEAVHRLGQADQYLAKMARFWGNMAVLLSHLMRETTLGEPWLEDINNPAVAEIFKKIMADAKEKWRLFAQVCGQYVRFAEKDPQLRISSLYGFLDGGVDKMNKQQRIAMMTEIRDEFIRKYDDKGDNEEAGP